MILLPAIDLYEKKVVRLTRGDYSQMTVYNDDPVAQAAQFQEAGAQWLHTVDLEGAKTGQTTNLPTIERIAAQTGLFVEVGGGIRSMDTVRRYLEAGASRVILGTAAVTDPDFTAQAVAQYGDKIAVGADLKDGKVAIKGWLETSQNTWETFFDQMQALGVRTMICTDISRDGAMEGTNRALYRTLARRNGLSLVACRLVTGRTHQIRAQFAAAGHPLLGDGKYGRQQQDKPYGRHGQALYSYKLAFRFTTDAGPLNGLNGRTWQVDTVDFVTEYFPEFSQAAGTRKT